MFFFSGCMVFNFDKRSQQCDMINSPGNSETYRPNFMTGPQMCGIMTGFTFDFPYWAFKNDVTQM